MTHPLLKGPGAVQKLVAGLVFAAVTAVAFAQDAAWTDLRKQSAKLFMSRDMEGALVLEKQALALAEKSSPTDPRIIKSLGAMGTFYSLSGRRALAIPLYERVVALHDQGVDHPMILATYTDLAAAYRSVGREADAKKIQARADKLK
jgi:tetratricopeptide (TPR) repeat protein